MPVPKLRAGIARIDCSGETRVEGGVRGRPPVPGAPVILTVAYEY